MILAADNKGLDQTAHAQSDLDLRAYPKGTLLLDTAHIISMKLPDAELLNS